MPADLDELCDLMQDSTLSSVKSEHTSSVTSTPARQRTMTSPDFEGNIVVTPPSPRLRHSISAPTSPSPPAQTFLSLSPTGLSGVAARRAATGKLTNRTLVRLQRMRLENSTLGIGLGMGRDDILDSVEDGAVSPRGWVTNEAQSPVAGVPHRLASAADGASPSQHPDLSFPSPVKFPFDPPVSPRLALAAARHSPMAQRVLVNNAHRVSNENDGSLSPTRRRPKLALTPVKNHSEIKKADTSPLSPLSPSHVPPAPYMGGGDETDWGAIPDSPMYSTDSRAETPLLDSPSRSISPRSSYYSSPVKSPSPKGSSFTSSLTSLHAPQSPIKAPPPVFTYKPSSSSSNKNIRSLRNTTFEIPPSPLKNNFSAGNQSEESDSSPRSKHGKYPVHDEFFSL